MTTVINNPGGGSTTEAGADSAAGIIIGVIAAIILVTLFVMYGIPAIRQGYMSADSAQPNTTNINVTVPTPASGDTSANQKP